MSVHTEFLAGLVTKIIEVNGVERKRYKKLDFIGDIDVEEDDSNGVLRLTMNGASAGTDNHQALTNRDANDAHTQYPLRSGSTLSGTYTWTSGNVAVDDGVLSATNLRRGTGDPDGVVSGNLGDWFQRTDGNGETYRNTDGGTTWAEFSVTGFVLRAAGNPDGSLAADIGIMYQDSSSGLWYRNTDGGTTWERVWIIPDPSAEDDGKTLQTSSGAPVWGDPLGATPSLVGLNFAVTYDDSSTSPGTGGDGSFRLNHADPTQATRLWVDSDTLSGNIGLLNIGTTGGTLVLRSDGGYVAYSIRNWDNGKVAGGFEYDLARIGNNGTLSTEAGGVTLTLLPVSNTQSGEHRRFTLSGTTTPGGIAAGQIRLNSANPATATEIYVHYQAAFGGTGTDTHDASAWYATLSGGTLTLTSATDPAVVHAFGLSGTPVDNSTYFTLPVTPIAGGNGSLSTAINGVVLGYVRDGSGSVPTPGGDLSNTISDAHVVAARFDGNRYTFGAVSDGQQLVRSGTEIVGQDIDPVLQPQLRFRFDTTQPQIAPASGKLAFINSATPSAVNSLSVSDTTDGGLNVAGLLQGSIFKIVTIRSVDTPTKWHVWYFKSLGDNSGNTALTDGVHLAGNGTFAANELLDVQLDSAGAQLATQSDPGLLSTTDKTKLDSLPPMFRLGPTNHGASGVTFNLDIASNWPQMPSNGFFSFEAVVANKSELGVVGSVRTFHGSVNTVSGALDSVDLFEEVSEIGTEGTDVATASIVSGQLRIVIELSENPADNDVHLAVRPTAWGADD